ncbi:maturase K [Gossypium australe]|uniref:Maturase K n=1 Tax=Gossypium australe TaxID=47621 RepID=A0A5B6UXJ5_9ROSI|nr:maturase K [Gossypium australe]
MMIAMNLKNCDPNLAVADDVESNSPARPQGAVPSKSRNVSNGHGGEAKETFFQMMNKWFTEFVQTNLAAQRPPSTPNPQLTSVSPQDELSCTLGECLKCAISLLRDTAYQWWNTLVSVVPRDRFTWEFFQTEFRKKYISQRFLDQKHKEFLELK